MSETEIAPAEGGADTGAPAEQGAAAQILENAEPPPVAPVEDDRSAHNRRMIEAERARRAAERAKAEAVAERKAAEEARAEAKRLAEQQSGEVDGMAQLVRAARGNPAKFQDLLEATGLSLDDYVRWKVNGGEVTPEQQLKSLDATLRDEIKAARDEVSALKKERDEERAERERQAAKQKSDESIAYFKGEIEKTLAADPDKYELTIAAGDEVEVLKLIRGAWVDHKVALTAAQAADMVEKHHRDLGERLAKTKFYSSKFQPQSSAAPSQPGKAATAAKTPDAKAKTASALTNSLVTSPAAPHDDASELESREAFVERQRERLRNAKKAAESAKK